LIRPLTKLEVHASKLWISLEIQMENTPLLILEVKINMIKVQEILLLVEDILVLEDKLVLMVLKTK